MNITTVKDVVGLGDRDFSELYHEYNIPYLAFLVLVAVFLAYTFVLVAGEAYVTRIVPQVIIGFTALILVADFLNTSGIVGIEKGDVLDTGEMAGSEEALDTKRLAIELLWVVLFIHGLYYVGVFTATSLFITSYILVNDDSPILRRILIALAWSVGVTGFSYLLFVRLMNIGVVQRLGILP